MILVDKVWFLSDDDAKESSGNASKDREGRNDE